MVRAKGVISVQIDAEKSEIIICATNKDSEDILDLFDSYGLTVPDFDIEEIIEEEENKENGGKYATPQHKQKKKKNMLTRVNGGSVQSKLDAKMKAREEKTGWLSKVTFSCFYCQLLTLCLATLTRRVHCLAGELVASRTF